jgi:CRISPR-associated endonuclease/helicase Cas3
LICFNFYVAIKYLLEKKMYFSHSLQDNPDYSKWHTLQEHLLSTARRSGDYGSVFNSENAAFICGALHDLGKYCLNFQHYIAKKALKGGDHSLAGAEALEGLVTTRSDTIIAMILKYAIAGHHAGLADYKELQKRIDRGDYNKADAVWRDEIGTNFGPLSPDFKHLSPDDGVRAFQRAFWGRMVFSCLVDADFKDTENFYKGHGQATADRTWPDLRAHVGALRGRFDAHMATIAARAAKKPSALNDLRADILAHILGQAERAPGLFTLTVPTGGGKTLASLGFAVRHAEAHGLRRIIYAIPFTSIIDQTAAIFRTLLGDDYILEHHASIEDQKFDAREQLSKLRLAMEDWAAPVVVTTNVQFFESLFAHRPAKCRKLHNIASSVIILDEAQSLPVHLVRPSLLALDELAKHYGCTIIFCTATQPAFDKRDFKFKNGLDLEGRELAPDPAGLAQQLTRVTILKGGALEDAALIDALGAQDQGLVIVNSRKHALALYQAGKEQGLEGLVHLTTRQYAAQRREILARVREDLTEGRPCRVIATSLIEAGVDVDFPRVWRAEAGLDNILQAAGRCNREGKQSAADSIVTVFKTPQYNPPPELEQAAAAFERMAGKCTDWLAPAAITEYFRELFWTKGEDGLDQKAILREFSISGGVAMFGYRTVAQNYRLIESGLTPIIINDSAAVAAVLNRLNSAEASPGKAARELQTFTVQVPPKDFQKLLDNGRIAYHRADLWGDQFAVLTVVQSDNLYTAETGLIWENADVLGESIW